MMTKDNIAEFDWLQDEMNKFLDYLKSTRRTSAGFTTTLWKPKINICERESHYLVEAEIPGVAPGKIKVTVENNTLTIEGERPPGAPKTKMKYLHMEISSGPFRREIKLPASVDPDTIAAESENGMLKISIGKIQPGVVRKIEIQSND
jgi:HSP20 family protein